MNEIEKRLQLESVLSFNNVKIITDFLLSCSIPTKQRILDDEFNTIIHNAKIEGQQELIDAFIIKANDFLTPRI